MTEQPNYPQKPKNRRLFLVLLGVLAAALLVVCTSVGWFAYQYFDESPENPSEAISQYFLSLQDRDADALSEVICSNSKQEAKKLISNFHKEFERDGVELTDIRWTNEGSQRGQNDKVLVKTKVSYEVVRSGETFVRRAQTRFTVEDNRICSSVEE